MSLTGFTLVEVLVALVVFAVGALGLTAETAALTRHIAREHRAAALAEAVTGRLERLRANACRARSDGVELVRYHTVPIAELQWTWQDPGDSTYQVTLVTAPSGTLAGASIPPDTLTARLWCRR